MVPTMVVTAALAVIPSAMEMGGILTANGAIVAVGRLSTAIGAVMIVSGVGAVRKITAHTGAKGPNLLFCILPTLAAEGMGRVGTAHRTGVKMSGIGTARRAIMIMGRVGTFGKVTAHTCQVHHLHRGRGFRR